MIDLSLIEMVLALFSGTVLGVVFFGGLWLTVQQLHTNKHPALLVIFSVVLRFGFLIMCFYWLMVGLHWQALLIALIGFFLVRAIGLRWGGNP